MSSHGIGMRGQGMLGYWGPPQSDEWRKGALGQQSTAVPCGHVGNALYQDSANHWWAPQQLVGSVSPMALPGSHDFGGMAGATLLEQYRMGNPLVVPGAYAVPPLMHPQNLLPRIATQEPQYWEGNVFERGRFYGEYGPGYGTYFVGETSTGGVGVRGHRPIEALMNGFDSRIFCAENESKRTTAFGNHSIFEQHSQVLQPLASVVGHLYMETNDEGPKFVPAQPADYNNGVYDCGALSFHEQNNFGSIDSKHREPGGVEDGVGNDFELSLERETTRNLTSTNRNASDRASRTTNDAAGLADYSLKKMCRTSPTDSDRHRDMSREESHSLRNISRLSKSHQDTSTSDGEVLHSSLPAADNLPGTEIGNCNNAAQAVDHNCDEHAHGTDCYCGTSSADCSTPSQPDNACSGHHTAPVFHPLPAMFTDPPQCRSALLSKQRIPTMAALQDCRMESRMVSEYADSHQEMSFMLSIPGSSVSQAPMLTLQQAGNLLHAINEPLSVLKVGRLTRNLVPKPELLRATEDMGTIALWLSPSSDVRLIWHSVLSSEFAADLESENQEANEHHTVDLADGFRELFCLVEASEELAWVQADSDRLEGGTGIKLEMLEQDPSGRSFRLVRRSNHVRQKKDLAARLAVEKARAGGHISKEMSKLHDLLNMCGTDPETDDDLFFWIAESSLKDGRQVLQNMSDQLNRLPTLSEKSGVPEGKLQEVYHWFSEAERASAPSQNKPSCESGTAHLDPKAELDANQATDSPETSGLQGYFPIPSNLMSAINPAYFVDGSSYERRSSTPTSVRQSTEIVDSEGAEETSQRAQTSSHNGHPESVRDACALSATANFLVSDKRLGLSHLSTAAVTVAVGVESTEQEQDLEVREQAVSRCVHQVAKSRAEACARAEAERLGRRRLEELAAERAAKTNKQTGSAKQPTKQSKDSSIVSLNAAPELPIATDNLSANSTADEASVNGENKTEPDVEKYFDRNLNQADRHSTSSSMVVNHDLVGDFGDIHTPQFQHSIDWQPRASPSAWGWGGNDLRQTGSSLFTSSSLSEHAHPSLSHDQAFGYHKVEDYWHQQGGAIQPGIVEGLRAPSHIPTCRNRRKRSTYSRSTRQMRNRATQFASNMHPSAFYHGQQAVHPWRWCNNYWQQQRTIPADGLGVSCTSNPGTVPIYPQYHTTSQMFTPMSGGDLPFPHFHYGLMQGNPSGGWVTSDTQLSGVTGFSGSQMVNIQQNQWNQYPMWVATNDQTCIGSSGYNNVEFGYGESVQSSRNDIRDLNRQAPLKGSRRSRKNGKRT